MTSVRLRYLSSLNPPVPEGMRADGQRVLSFVPMEAIGEDFSLDLSRTRPVAEVLAGYSYFEEGDILLAKVTPCFENGKVAIASGLVSGAGFGTTEVTVVRPASTVNTKFLFYVLNEDRFKQTGTASMTGAGGLKRVPDRAISDFAIELPDRDQQDVIASFLDREMAEIDAFIADQEELIALLTERRAATISHAVTKGLDPTVPMKDSGVEWLGEVPEHWNVTRISRYFAVTLGKMLDAGKQAVAGATVLPYIRAANIQETGLVTTSSNEMAFSAEEARNLSIRAGDLLVVEGGAVGVNAYIEYDLDGWSFQKTVNRLRPLSVNASSRYVGFVLDALRWSGVLDMVANKSTIAHLTAEKLERLVVGFPPPSEQASINEFLLAETAELDAAIADAREAIALSKERRAALISAAVTGKIDVRATV